MSHQSCVVCAWREDCNKRFSVCDGGSRCPDFSRDVSIRNTVEDTSKPVDSSPVKPGTSLDQITKESHIR